MHFVSGKVFQRLGSKINITQFTSREKTGVLSCTTVNVQTRCKTKLSRPSLFAPDNTSAGPHQERTERIGLHGYFLLGIPIATFLLGTWQIQRRKWKLKLIDDLEKKVSQEPIDLVKILDELDSKDYYPVKVKGTFLHDEEIILGPRSLITDMLESEVERKIVTTSDTNRGYCVITPFKLADHDLKILVNRGWVPREYRYRTRRPTDRVEGVVEITGIVRLNEARPAYVPENVPKEGIWFYRDLNAMAKVLDTAPVYIEMAYKKDFPGLPISGQTRVTMRNSHLFYIGTWYTLSVATAAMWYRMFIMKLPLL